MTNLQISKLDAARSQLDTAIGLYFHGGDPVSIHTLGAATYNLLRDLAKRHGTEVFLKGTARELIVPERKKEYFDALNKAENYFKHADKDFSEGLNFNPILTEFILWEAGVIFQRLIQERSPFVHLFDVWFMLRHKSLFTALPENQRQSFASLDYQETERLRYFNDIMPELMKRDIR